MPLYNWIKCNGGEVSFVRREGVKNEGKDEQKFSELYDQYIKKYGLSKIYIKMLKVMQQKALLELEFVITRERFKLTEIEIEQRKLQGIIESNGSGMTIEESIVYLSKWLGYRLNPKEVTVVEYYNILKQYGKANK